MPLWRFTDKCLKIGDELEGYRVLAITHKVPLSVLVYNEGRRLLGLPTEPEIAKQCVQLTSASQLEFPF